MFTLLYSIVIRISSLKINLRGKSYAVSISVRLTNLILRKILLLKLNFYNKIYFRYMRWPEELVVGGVEKNKTGMISDARALQSVIQLMGPRDMLEYWSNTYKVIHFLLHLKIS